MSRVRCLYCKQENDALQTAGYCEGCGKKLPPASLARSRGEGRARELPGLPPEAERRVGQHPSGLLLTAAVLQLVAGGLLLIVGPLLVPPQRMPENFLPAIITGSAVQLFVYAVLGWWASRRPLPAALGGLVLWILVTLLDLAASPALTAWGMPIKLVILAVLVQAVRLARKQGRPVAGL
jgi:hypothetical protein